MLFAAKDGFIDFSKTTTVLILVADKPTIAGNIYPSETVRKLVADFKPGMGELDGGYPPGHELNLSRVSHLVTEMWFDENDKSLYAKIRIIDTPSGGVLKSIVREAAFGRSTPGLDFRLASVASVADGVVNEDIRYLQIYASVPKADFK